MNKSPRGNGGRLCLALLLLAAFSSSLLAQESKSTPLVKELTTLLDQAKLDSIAARESGPDGYVAALYYPGLQLLVVSARYKEPVLLNDKIESKDYREIYVDLNSASLPNTKCLVMDLGADGLKAKREEDKAFDTYESAGKQYQFDGEWKAQKISEQDYQKAFDEADARYAKMLQALIAQMKKSS